MRTAFVLVAALAGACSSSSSTRSNQVAPEEARSLLIDRNWLDRMPETERDRLHVYRFVPSMGGGVFQDRTLFKGTFELFSFKVDGNKILFELHETKDRVASEFRIERVDGPAPFDLKLTIPDDPRGPKVYFGIRAETDRTGAALEQRLH
ncbi:MAG TPA: hypothetical protein VM513_05690 [Kofleriaceae bacterium]|nr:hypothetical protein [Kofleriaceae bacterium]